MDAWSPALGSVAAATVAGYLLTAMCLGSPTRLTDSENGPLAILGEAEESRCLPIRCSKTRRARVAGLVEDV